MSGRPDADRSNAGTCAGSRHLGVSGPLLLTHTTERLGDERRRHAKPLFDQCRQDRAQLRQDARLVSLHEHPERSADSRSSVGSHSPPCAFVDEEQVGAELLGEQDGLRLARVKTEIHFRQCSSSTISQEASRTSATPGAPGRAVTTSSRTTAGIPTSPNSAGSTSAEPTRESRMSGELSLTTTTARQLPRVGSSSSSRLKSSRS